MLWYAIWDSGIHLDHSVRTRKEAISMARENLKVILGLLDGRVLAGDEELVGPLFTNAKELWKREWERYLPELKESIALRHKNFGELAFLLEPDLKQAQGGLRDIGVLHALGEALPEIKELAESRPIQDAEQVITQARVAVHCRTSSAGDRLLLQEQDQVAKTLGYQDADLLMAAMAEAGRAITTGINESWHRIAIIQRPSDEPDDDEAAIGADIVWRRGEVALRANADVTGHPELVIKIGLAAAERNALISRTTLDHLERDATPPAQPWSDELRNKFIALLQTGDALIPVVEALDQRRLFELFVPEWTTVRNRPQRNAYHRFTVDRHLLEAIARSSEHLGMVDRPDLLVMAAMLHDIGKGTPGDHSEAGVELGTTIATRMGFDERDVATLAKLVLYHLVLPECATRRDIDDPATATLVAKLVGDHSTLELLAALTEADGQATGSSAWGPWKSELVTNLVHRVAAVLDGTTAPEHTFVPTPEQVALLERGEVALLAQGRHVTVVAPDTTGLFAAVTGALALSGCNVRRATAVEGITGMALEIFDIEQSFQRPVDWKKVEQNVINAFAGSTPLTDRIRERDDTYAKGRRAASAYPTKAHVKIDNDASDRATIIEVRAVDRLGLLHHITTALATAGLDVVSALVDTLGHEVIDTFYVHDHEGEKLHDKETIASITNALNKVISEFSNS
jgi:[protein-PII] uridylyltransferase